MQKSLCVIIPTYNEKENIAPLVERLDRALSGRDYEVVFVDDNSRDGTAEAASALAERFPVRVIVRRNERGLASAVIEGMKQSDSKYVLVMDADLQHPPEVVPDLLKALDNGADMAIASRYVPGGGCQDWGLIRRIISRVAIILAHLLLPSTRSVRDVSSGFFAFERKAVAGARLSPIGYKIMLEVMVEGNFRKVVEVPFVFRSRERGKSKLNMRQQVHYLKHLYRLMKRKGEIKRALKFGLVGLSGVVVNEGLLWIMVDFVRLPLGVASPIAVEASIISNFTLNDYFTFADRRSRGAGAFFTRLGKFNAVSLVGLGLNVGTLLLLNNTLGVHYLLANLAGIVVATLWNYLVNHWWTWK